MNDDAELSEALCLDNNVETAEDWLASWRRLYNIKGFSNAKTESFKGFSREELLKTTTSKEFLHQQKHKTSTSQT